MAETRITREQVMHVARLAKLSLTEPELARMTQELGAILQYVEHLNELDTSGVEPTAQVGTDALPLRADTQEPSLPRDPILAQAPKSGHDGFVVPAILDE